jgi:hypothetical protein
VEEKCQSLFETTWNFVVKPDFETAEADDLAAAI